MTIKKQQINKRYFIVVTVLTCLLPAICIALELIMKKSILSIDLAGKWFIFSAVGLRLFIAGIKQTTDPAFTAREIFHINNTESHTVVRELGFANLCFGITGIASLLFPSWRIVSAFASGLYYGMAAAMHLFRKVTGINEKFALITDMIIFILLVIYFVKMS